MPRLAGEVAILKGENICVSTQCTRVRTISSQDGVCSADIRGIVHCGMNCVIPGNQAVVKEVISVPGLGQCATHLITTVDSQCGETETME